MSEDVVSHVFTVRGRPVGFQSGRFGGALVAVERGYFPISATGYRSLAGHFAFDGRADATTILAEFLESLAIKQDRERHAIQVRLQRTPRVSSDRLGNFVGASIEAERALAEGFFAPDAERFELWRGAHRLLRLIDTDVRFQPAPCAPAWSALQCAVSLATHRKLLRYIEGLSSGSVSTLQCHWSQASRTYFALAPRAGGEPRFPLTAFTSELLIASPSRETCEDEEFEAEAVIAETVSGPLDCDSQMSLF